MVIDGSDSMKVRKMADCPRLKPQLQVQERQDHQDNDYCRQRHGVKLAAMPINCRCSRRSSVSSGWNAVTSRLSWRAATA